MAGHLIVTSSSEAVVRPKTRCVALQNVIIGSVAKDIDVLQGIPDVTISAGAAISSHLDTTSNCSQLIKGEFGVGHWFEVLWRCFSDVHTISAIRGLCNDPSHLKL